MGFPCVFRCMLASIIAVSISGCKSERGSDTALLQDSIAQKPAPSLDSIIVNSSIMTLDSGVILVATPDTTDSIQPAGPLVALNDSTKPAAVPIPNAVLADQSAKNDSLLRDLLKTELRKAKDRLDSMEVPAEKPAGKK